MQFELTLNKTFFSIYLCYVNICTQNIQIFRWLLSINFFDIYCISNTFIRLCYLNRKRTQILTHGLMNGLSMYFSKPIIISGYYEDGSHRFHSVQSIKIEYANVYLSISKKNKQLTILITLYKLNHIKYNIGKGN